MSLGFCCCGLGYFCVGVFLCVYVCVHMCVCVRACVCITYGGGGVGGVLYCCNLFVFWKGGWEMLKQYFDMVGCFLV